VNAPGSGSVFTVPVALTIRPCIADDLPKLEWFGQFTEHRELIQDAFERQRRGENLMLHVVTNANGFPIGQIWIDLERKREAKTGLLWALRVIDCYQRMGIGTRLLAAAEAELRRRGYRCAEIGAERDNPGARRLYERLGYRVFGRDRHWYGYTTPWGERRRTLVDEWVMHKDLDGGGCTHQPQLG
jgi:ribosomal protein S18 acetylase RimI-like enzyme